MDNFRRKYDVRKYKVCLNDIHRTLKKRVSLPNRHTQCELGEDS